MVIWKVHRKTLKAHVFIGTREKSACLMMHEDDTLRVHVKPDDKCKMCVRHAMRHVMEEKGAMPENQKQETFRPKQPMFTQDLDAIECANPGCKDEHPLFLHPPCHANAGIAMSYWNSVLSMRCATCAKLVCTVQVAEADVQ